MAPPSTGVLLAICGLDGSGKSTQVDVAATALRRTGWDVVTTRQPTDWYRGRPDVRRFLRSGGAVGVAGELARLAAEDRRRHVSKVIEPALRRGAAVVTDRYVYSSIAYFAHRGVPPNEIITLNAGIPRPHLALFLDAPPDVLQERIRARDGGLLKKEEQSSESLASIRETFLRMRGELEILDVREDPPQVAAELVAALRRRGVLTDGS